MVWRVVSGLVFSSFDDLIIIEETAAACFNSTISLVQTFIIAT